MKKLNIAIIAGGYSSEAGVSMQSAANLAKMMDTPEYNLTTVTISKDEWTANGKGFKNLAVNREDFTIMVKKKKIHFDCALLAIHGTPGEDGTLQAYFDLLNIPYTSSGVFSSALTFNKYACKIFLSNFGILSAKTIRIKRGEKIETSKLIAETGLPCFVKPNESGSSFGVSRVDRKDQLLKAISIAFDEGDEVLIEEYIKGREITCGIIKTPQKQIILPITEIIPKSKSGYFDLEAKYKGLSDEITPARIPAGLTKECNKLTSAIYDLCNCRGIVRIDYIISNDKPYFLEINSVPGMTLKSIIPQQIKAAGLKPGDVLSLVITDAIKRQK